MPYRIAQRLSHAEDALIDTAADALSHVRRFLKREDAGGILLAAAAVLALIIANTFLFEVYDFFLNGIRFRIGFDSYHQDFDFEIRKSLLLWINDGLMAVFFFLIGLEIKREIMQGQLSRKSDAVLPVLAAIGGIAAPALIFWWINKDIPGNLDGWAIPAATDIAFALGVVALLGSRVPVQLKILLTTIAVIDDIAAILIIAFFYTGTILTGPLYVAGLAVAVLWALNYYHVSRLGPYILMSMILWVAVLESGIHATLAGVLAALFIPMYCTKEPEPEDGIYPSPCKDLEHALHPWVHFLVLPLFALANAGVSFSGMGPEALLDPLTVGIIAGLVVGKQLGVFSLLLIAVKTGLSRMPTGANWAQMYALSVLCGIGFTMSLFIGELAFDGVDKQASIRLGVLVASLVSAGLGYTILHLSSHEEDQNKSGAKAAEE